MLLVAFDIVNLHADTPHTILLGALKAVRQHGQNISTKNSNTLLFYSNRYLHCIRPQCENILKTVYVILEKTGKNYHNLIN